jgi:hypothetical protein
MGILPMSCWIVTHGQNAHAAAVGCWEALQIMASAEQRDVFIV